MKKPFLLFLVLLCSLQNYAFSHDSALVAKSKPAEIGILDKTGVQVRQPWFDYTYFGLTYSGWQKIPAGSDVKEDFGNIGFDVFGLHSIPLFNEAIHLGYGLGFSVMNFHTNYYAFEFNANGTPNQLLRKDHPDFIYKSVTQGLEIKRNKMSLTYLEIPLELKVPFLPGGAKREKRGFLIAAGVRGGWLMDAHYKMVTDDAKFKTKDFDNLHRWRLGFTARLGYGMISLFGRLDVTSTFAAPNVPDYTPMSFGIVLSGF